MRQKGFIMYEDFNEQDFALNATLMPMVQNDPYEQFWLNMVAGMAKFVLETYISNKNTSIQYRLYDNVICGLKQCVLSLQEPKVREKLSTFLRLPSIESAQGVVSELDRYIAIHEIKHN